MRGAGWLAAATVVGCSFDPPALSSAIDAAIDAPPGTPDASLASDGPPGPDADPGACPPSYASYAFESSRYRIASGDWYAGETACEADGAHLVVIDSPGENTAVRGFVAGTDVWIGMSDHQVEGTFRWVVDTATQTGNPPWAGAQPDNHNTNEDCGEMWQADGAWNDEDCDINQVYICECDGVAVPTTPTWCETDIDTACEDCTDDCTAMGGGEVCENHACMPE